MSRFSNILFLSVSLIALALSPPAFGQFEDVGTKIDLGEFGDFGDVLGSRPSYGDPLEIESFIVPAQGQEPAQLVIRANIATGWNIYSLTQKSGGPPKTEITLNDSDKFELINGFVPQEKPKVSVKQDVWPDLEVEEHFGVVTWTAPIRFSEGVEPASIAISGELTKGQVCHPKKGCLGFGIALEPKFTAELATEEQIASIRPAAKPAFGEIGEYDDARNNLSIRGYVEPQVVKPGETAKLHLTVEMEPGWHIYEREDAVESGRPTLIPLVNTSGLEPRAPVVDGEVIEKDGLRYHEETTTWTIEFPIKKTTAEGDYPIEGHIAYLSCSDKTCLSPSAVKFTANIQVGDKKIGGQSAVAFTKSSYGVANQANASRIAWAEASPADSMKTDSVAGNKPDDFWGYVFSRFGFREVDNGKWGCFPGGDAPSAKPLWNMTFSRGQLIFLSIVLCFLASFAAGLVLNVMPCVLPVIGLKIMSFAQQGGESRGKVFALNVWYSLGLLSVFLAIAAFAASLHMLGKTLAWGEHLGDPRFAVPLLGLVFVLGLSMFGVWEIPIPGFASSGRTTELASKEGPAGAFFKGVLTTILATPCGGPFIGLAVGIAVIAPIWLNFSIFASMALGMASPYLIIGAFPQLVGFIPKPGPWMEAFKQFMGFLLMGTAVWILSFLSESYVVSSLAMLVGFGVVCWIFGRTAVTASGATKAKRYATALAVGVLSVFMYTWLLPTPDILPWEKFTRSTLDQRIEQGHVVLVDFTADW